MHLTTSQPLTSMGNSPAYPPEEAILEASRLLTEYHLSFYQSNPLAVAVQSGGWLKALDAHLQRHPQLREPVENIMDVWKKN